MKKSKFSAMLMAALIVLSGCGMNNTAKGGLIGGGAGAGIGAMVGNLIGRNAGGTLAGAAIGAAVGTGAGLLIGKKMDKAKAAAAALAATETYTDANGLEGVKVTFDNGILFATGKATLTTKAQSTLQKFATDVLNVYNDVDVNIYGFASSDGSDATNLTLSKNRASAVANYLKQCGVADGQIKTTTGFGEDAGYLIYNADGTENQAASRRVELYMYASEEMIAAANAGTLK